MQPNDESFPENNVEAPQPPVTPTQPDEPTPSQPQQSPTFQPPVMDAQPQPEQPAPVVEQPKKTGFFGKIKSMFSKK